MAFLNALADVLRPRPTIQATGTTSSAADTTYASMSTTGAVAGGPPPAAGALETGPQMTTEEYEPSTQEKQLMLHLSNVSHGVNHYQKHIMTMLSPSIMGAVGMSRSAVGGPSAIVSLPKRIGQGAYGLL